MKSRLYVRCLRLWLIDDLFRYWNYWTIGHIRQYFGRHKTPPPPPDKTLTLTGKPSWRRKSWGLPWGVNRTILCPNITDETLYYYLEGKFECKTTMHDFVLYDMHKGYCGNSGPYNLSETTRRLCMNIGYTSRIITTVSPGGLSHTSATTQYPITTCPTCPTCPSYTSTEATIVTVMYGKLLYYYNTTLTTLNHMNATPALGAMVGLLLILLAAVTAGWLWTCWVMRKRGAMKQKQGYRWGKQRTYQFIVQAKRRHLWIHNSHPQNTLELINSTCPTDVTLKELQNPIYETTTEEWVVKPQTSRK